MSPVRLTHLRCEYLVNPLGLDERAPRLSWQLESDARGVRQTAYRILVASSADKLASGTPDLWDSGRVESNATTHIPYAGTPLTSRQRCHWHVEAWISHPQVSGLSPQVSPAASWTMGLLSPSDWSARWIAADPEIIRRDPSAIAPTLTEPGTPALFRREFDLPGPIARATVYATARGLVELHTNGRRIGDDLFAPEWTDYDQRIHYRTYDVTGLLAPGANCLAATLGDGWWSGYVGWQEQRGRYGSLENSLLIQLEVELADGSRLTLGTDGSWTCNTGPILSSDFMMGEAYDARREIPGWNEAEGRARTPLRAEAASGVAALPWLPSKEVPAPTARLVAQRAEPVRIIETIRPDPAGHPPAGTLLFDCRQNISGWVQLRIFGFPAGTTITLRHGERLTPEGTLYTENLRRAKATDTYVTGGAAFETWQPHFTFHGFQYFELSFSTPPPPSALVIPIACVIHSAMPPAGHFECSRPDVNRLWLNGLWSQKDNFLTVPTDCPQRDERLGWMGDAQVFCRTASCNMDVAAFFTKWMVDVEDAQTPEGIFPDVAPRLREDINWVGLPGLGGAAGWADAGVIIPYTMWRVYGDRRILERHYGAMVKWVDWIASHNPGGLRVNQLANNYGDWLCLPSDTSFGTHSPMKNLLATAYWADDCTKLARIARELGRDADAARFSAMFEKVRAAFQKEWLQPDGRITTDTQTGYLLALAFDLLPPGLRAATTGHLVANIRDLGWHLSTGFVGISHLNPQLTLAGHSDVAYRLLLQDTYPSWLYPVQHGATTIWERWNGWTHADGFFNPHMNSFNHYSLGSVGEWLFRHVAGIELDPDEPGYQRFMLKPFIGPGLDFARATYRTLHGEIASHWRKVGDRLVWTVTVPPNTSARVYIPSLPDAPLETDGLTVTGREGSFAICEAPSGTYTFTSVIRIYSNPAG